MCAHFQMYVTHRDSIKRQLYSELKSAQSTYFTISYLYDRNNCFKIDVDTTYHCYILLYIETALRMLLTVGELNEQCMVG